MASGWPPLNDKENPIESLIFIYCYYAMLVATLLGTWAMVNVVKMVQKPYFGLFDENDPYPIKPSRRLLAPSKSVRDPMSRRQESVDL
jgi:hypothetical protein